MMFDELLDVDMDEMIYAYYGGMLGKATNVCHLRCVMLMILLLNYRIISGH